MFEILTKCLLTMSLVLNNIAQIFFAVVVVYINKTICFNSAVLTCADTP